MIKYKILINISQHQCQKLVIINKFKIKKTKNRALGSI
jgi:hypothetical protein